MGLPTAAALAAAVSLLVNVATPQLERAMAIGRSAEAERARFHAAYTIEVDTGDQLATVERIEVVTEFRRAVMIVEDHARFGDYMFGIPQLEAALRQYHDQVAVRARLRFNPMNTLTVVPAYELRVGAPDDRLLALGPTKRSAIYVTGENQRRGDSQAQALVGANLEIAFDSGIVGQNRYPITVVLDGKTIAGAPVDFARLD